MHALPLAGTICLFFAWPRTIRFDGTGISQRNLLGRTKHIGYEEIVYISYIPADFGSTLVAGPRTEIRHTFLHANELGFHEMLEQRTGQKVRAPLP